MEIILIIFNLLLCYMNYNNESYKSSILSAFTVGIILGAMIVRILECC